MDTLVRNFFNLEIMQAAGPFLLKGLGMPFQTRETAGSRS